MSRCARVEPVIALVLEAFEQSGYTPCMLQVAKLLNEMVEAGVLLDYAVFGAVAQM